MDNLFKAITSVGKMADLISDGKENYQKVLNTLMTAETKAIEEKVESAHLNNLLFTEDLCRIFISTAESIELAKKKHFK